MNIQKENAITEGVIWKQILLFFFPILFGTFFQQLYNAADALIVGRFVGKEALSAVGGGTGTVINLLVGFFVGLASGATVIISQYYGAKREEMVGYAVHTAMAFSLVGGVVMTVGGLLAAPGILRAMDTPTDVLEPATLYIRVYFLGMAGNLIYNVGSGILRAAGDSRRPLYFLIASAGHSAGGGAWHGRGRSRSGHDSVPAAQCGAGDLGAGTYQGYASSGYQKNPF